MNKKAVIFPDKIDLALLPTPLQPLDKLSSQLKGPRIWLKRDDLSGCAESGNKIRKLEYTFAEVIKNGCDTVITCGGLQSNHCRATALLARRLGLKCILLLRGDKPTHYQGNTLIDVLSGAEVHYIDAAHYQSNLPQMLETCKIKLQQRGRKAWVIPTGASDGIGIWGYINAIAELQRDIEALSIKPSHIITATGSGGTQAGLTLGCQLFGLNSKVVGINVCDDKEYFQQKVKADIQEWQLLYDPKMIFDTESITVNVIDGYVGKGYAKASEDVFNTIRLLAECEGVVLDPIYTGKAFFGLIEEIRKGFFNSADDIIFIHTGGIHGLYAYQEDISQWLDHKHT